MSRRLPPIRANHPMPLVSEAALAGAAVYLVRYQAITALQVTHQVSFRKAVQAHGEERKTAT
jgi:hypothetical protein